jgi:hypothetical protein
MLLVKYENDVVPHNSVFPASGMMVGDVTATTSKYKGMDKPPK